MYNIKDNKDYLTSFEVAEIMELTQRQVTNLIRKGKIKADRADDDQYLIRKAEFFISFPELMAKFETKKREEVLKINFLEEKIKFLEDMIKEKRQHAEFLAEQIHVYNTEKSKILDSLNAHTRLLEYKESGTKKDYQEKEQAKEKPKKSLLHKLFTRED